MKPKTIDKLLHRKLNDFANSVKDKKVKEAIKKDSIITGGCITSMLLKENINDFDIYFSNYDSALLITEYFINEFKKDNNNYSINIENYNEMFKQSIIDKKITKEEINKIRKRKDRISIKVVSTGVADNSEVKDENISKILDVTPKSKNKSNKRYKPLFISSNAITLSNKIQLIVRFIGKPETIHSNYDFVHTMNYWTPREGLVLNKDSLASIISKELIYVGSKYPLASIIRTRKFIKRNWTVNAGQYVKMALQLNNMDLTNLDIFKEQLTGVDLTYFQSMIDSIPEGQKIDETYLIKLINKYF